MRKLRMMTIYNKNQLAYEDFLSLVNTIPNKYNFLFQSINDLFNDNVRLCVEFSEDTKNKEHLKGMLNNTKQIISIFDAFIKTKILTENQYLRFQNQADALLAYLKAAIYKDQNVDSKLQ